MAKNNKSNSPESGENGAAFNAKEIQKEAAKAGRKVKMNDRVKLKVLNETKFYKAGQIINPHRVYAEKMIAEGTAEEVK